METRNDWLGVGVYTVVEASRMTGVSSRRIRRWLLGYTFRSGDRTRASQPVWRSDLPVIEGAPALSFRDMIEVRFVDYFLECGVTWKALRQAQQAAADLLGTTHPFSTRRLRTDGKSIFAELGEKRLGRKLLDVARRQYGLPSVVAPRLYSGLEFRADDPARWFPFGRNQRIVIDPEVGFGQPVVNPEGVPTAVLARAFDAEQDLARVAVWYRVPRASVRKALEYEDRRAA